MPEDFARINLTIPRQVHETLTKNIPKGMRNNAYLCLLAKFAEKLDRDGMVVLMKTLQGRFTIELEEN